MIKYVIGRGVEIGRQAPFRAVSRQTGGGSNPLHGTADLDGRKKVSI